MVSFLILKTANMHELLNSFHLNYPIPGLTL